MSEQRSDLKEIVIRENKIGLEVSHAWSQDSNLFGVILLSCLLIAIGSYLFSNAGHRPFLFVVAILGLCVGVIILLYIGIANTFNSTTLTLTELALAVRHGPVPWLGNQTVRYREIYRLRCEELPIIGRGGRVIGYLYRLCADLQQGKTLHLLLWVKDYQTVLYVKALIEHKLAKTTIQHGQPDEQ